MAVMTVSEARAALPEVLDRVEGGEEITITRHGRPVAVVIRPDIMRSRSRAEAVMTDAAKLHDMLASAAGGKDAGQGGLSEQYAEELIASIRAGRDGSAR
jgi:antitoxin (DNA-binding transcriptional repressor) of toxin-antitoxin stability system